MTYYVTVEKSPGSAFYIFTTRRHGCKVECSQLWPDKRTGFIYTEARLPVGAKIKIKDATV